RGARGLLADRPQSDRRRLVDEPRGLSADAELDDHEVGAVERGVEDTGELEATRPAEAREHPSGHAADDLRAVRIDVEEDQVVDPDAIVANGKPLDPLRRVRAAATDDGDLD